MNSSEQKRIIEEKVPNVLFGVISCNYKLPKLIKHQATKIVVKDFFEVDGVKIERQSECIVKGGIN